jgi:sulfur-oxidizing protein SoxY
LLSGLASGVLFAGPAAALAEAATEEDRWPSLAAQIFPSRQLIDGAGVLSLEAPARAEDAALVPILVHTLKSEADAGRVRKISLIIEGNPSPLAAVFTLGEGAGVRRIATSVRVNDYTNIRAVAETSDGGLYEVARFVKAAGGCSAPAVNQNADTIPRGTLRLRTFSAIAHPGAAARPELQVMVRHPNFSGMQMDQVSRLYIPADFVQTLRVFQGEDLLLTVDSGISISENPSFRFDFVLNDARSFRVEATDSGGNLFIGTFPKQDDLL